MKRPTTIIIIVFYSSKAQQMCWQGSKLSEYIQGVNEHIKYTQKYTLWISVMGQ